MPYFKHVRTGSVIYLEDGSLLMSMWKEIDTDYSYNETIDLDKQTEEITESDAVYLESTTENIADAEEKFELNENIQTFDTVKDLKKDADKAFAAQTKRGSIYDYVDGEWRKADDEN